MGSDRRVAVRREPSGDETLAGVRLRAGGVMTVVNISSAGALVEGCARLLPGTHVELHVVTRDGRTLIRGRVVRAWVFELEAEKVLYRAAVAFERYVDTTPSRVIATRTFVNDVEAGRSYPSIPTES